MNAPKIVLIVLLISVLIVWIRGGADFPIVQVLPFCGGHSPGIYDLAAVIMLAITFWGLRRLSRRGRKDGDPTIRDRDE